MSFPRARVAHVVTWRLLFVIGGWFDTELVNTVEYYDPAIDKWETVAPMLSARAQAAAHALNEFIYVLGGADEKRVLQSIERYNVGENSWTKVNFWLSFHDSFRSGRCILFRKRKGNIYFISFVAVARNRMYRLAINCC